MRSCRIRREECSAVKHDRYFTRWKVLIGHTDWRDQEENSGGLTPKYRLQNLPSKKSVKAGVYELGIIKPCVEGRRKNKGKLRKRDVIAVYVGQADNVRQRLQSYGQRGSHLEGWSGLERWLPEKRILTQLLRQGPRLFSEIFARGYSLAFRWSSTVSKEAALDAEQKLLKVFDYAWNKGANGNRRSLDILTRLEMQSNVMCGTRSSSAINRRMKWSGVFKRRAGVTLDLTRPRDENSKGLSNRIAGLVRRIFRLGNTQMRVTTTRTAGSIHISGNSRERKMKRADQKQRRGKLYGVRIEEVSSRPKKQIDKRCGVIFAGGVSCDLVPVKGRKRCELHKGMRLSLQY